jgi:hypothetical protein
MLMAVPLLADTSVVYQAQKRVNEADAQFRQARAALVIEAKRLMKVQESTPQWQKGAAALKEAQNHHDQAATKAKAKLFSDPSYKSAVAERDRIINQREALRADPKATPEQRTDAAVAVLKASSAVSKLEQQALAEDPQVSQTQSALEQSQYVMEQLQKAAAVEASKDPAYQSAKQRVESANTQVAQAQQQLQEAKKQQAKADEQKLNQDIQDRQKLIFDPNRR